MKIDRKKDFLLFAKESPFLSEKPIEPENQRSAFMKIARQISKELEAVTRGLQTLTKS